jgi:hypothetical protein
MWCTVRSRWAADDGGGVTAEFAVALPAVLVVLACCLCALQLAGEQLRLQDAASIAARTIARGEGLGSAVIRVHSLVPGASLARSDRGELVCVRASASASLRFLGGIELGASSCALGG